MLGLHDAAWVEELISTSLERGSEWEIPQKLRMPNLGIQLLD